MFSLEEQIILNNIDKKYSWIAREEDGGLWIFRQKPVKISNGRWHGRPYLDFTMYNDLFDNIKWEDEEPTKIGRESLDYNLIELVNMYQSIKNVPLCDGFTVKFNENGIEKHEPAEIVRNEKTGLSELVLRPKVQVVRDVFGDKALSRLGSKIVTGIPSSNNASNRAKQVIDNQVKKGMERYGRGIEDCDLSIKELLDNALEENADAMIYLSELRARLFGNENK